MGDTLLDLAKTNLTSAKINMRHLSDDDRLINIVAFHLQQATGLYLMYHLEAHRRTYPRTRDIGRLLAVFEIKLVPRPAGFSDLGRLAYTITAWGGRAKDVKNFRANQTEVAAVLALLDSIL